MLPTDTPRSFRDEASSRISKTPGSARYFERRYGSPALLQHDDAAPLEYAKPSLRPGMNAFTDPRNPSNRCPSKKMVPKEVAYQESDRAGARTRNPRVIPVARGDSAREGRDWRVNGAVFTELRYSQGSDWRPSKRVANSLACGGSPTPRSSDGVVSCWAAETVPKAAGAAGLRSQQLANATVLENYLNDMKHVVCSRKPVSSKPSETLKRVNDRSLPPAERSGYRSASVNPRHSEAGPGTAGVPTGGNSISRSLSCRRLWSGSMEPNYGFTRKREISAPWTSRRHEEFLHHTDTEGRSCPGTPRSCSSLRSWRDDAEGARPLSASKDGNPSSTANRRASPSIFLCGSSPRSHGLTPRRAA